MDLKPQQCCQNETYHCSLPVLPGSVYCHQHVLHEKGKSQYKRCEYLYGNRKRCTLAVLKDKNDDKKQKLFCDLHKPKEEDEFRQPVLRSQEELLKMLTKQLKIKTDDVSENFKSYEHVINLQKATEPLDLSKFTEQLREDEENYTLNSFRKLGENWSDSDTEREDSEEDCLKHSGIYTEQELVRCNINSMKKLSRLYTQEMKLLELKMIKLDEEYRATDKNEDFLSDQAKVRKYNNYRRFNRLMNQVRGANKVRDPRRAKSTTPFEKCAYIDYIIKCPNKPFEDSPYCFKHICEDKEQFLYKPCGHKIGENFCKEPILKIENACVYHTEFTEEKENQDAPIRVPEVENENSYDSDESETSIVEIEEDHNSVAYPCDDTEYYNLLEEIEANL